MSPTRGEIESFFDKDDIHERMIEKEVRARIFRRILDQDFFSEPLDLASNSSRELYFIGIYADLFLPIQLQARVGGVRSIKATRDIGGPSLLVRYSSAHLLSVDNWDETEIKITSDKRSWGVDTPTEEEAERFALHFDNLCYALEQIQRD